MRPGEAHPIGYVEHQRGWVGEPSAVPMMVKILLQEMHVAAAADNPSLKFTGARCEVTRDAAGLNHYVVYAGYAPAVPAAEPLNPRDLNAASNPNLHTADIPGGPLGMKENKF